MATPDKELRRMSIDRIMDAGIPPKKRALRELSTMMTVLGFKYAFRGVGDAALTAVTLSAALLITASFFGVYSDASIVYLPISFFAPTLYFTLLAFTSWKERMTRTYEIIESCKYNLIYITALRTAFASPAGMLIIPIATLPLISTGVYPDIVMTALCSLMIYSVLSIVSFLISESFVWRMLVPALWVVFWGGACILLPPNELETFVRDAVMSAGGYVTATVIVGLVVIYLILLRLYVLKSSERTTASEMEGAHA